MKLAISPTSITRTPVFSHQKDLCAVWNELKDYIHESSPSFFEMIKDYAYEDLQSLEPKIRFTIWKYFNRAKFRATPYGNFAAFSVVPVSKDNKTEPVTLSKTHLVHRFINWQEKENFNFESKWLIRHAGFLTTNTTAYAGGGELRYLSTENGSFELSAIGAEETTQSTLNYCRTKRTVEEIQKFLRNEHSLSPAMTNYFLEQLVTFQLLITNFQPNIIGPDYYGRIGYAQTDKKNDYIIAERKRIKGQLSERRLQVLTELTEFLSKHTMVKKNPSLDDFRHQFIKKFEHKEVPLQIAMDPEIGIGYRSMTVDKDEGQLINELKKTRTSEQTHHIPYTALHQFILNQMIQQKIVQLHDFKDPGTVPQPQVPNTLSILLQSTEEHLIIRNLGGCTANSLLGRFSLASEEVTQIGHRFVEIEQEANPDILFFDIGYQIEKHADNINRRKAIYDYELPILSWPESKHILALDDIMVSVRGEELVLHSVKYGKRLIPKLASAYNYTRSDLAVYRFLSDLQHQGMHTSLGLSLSSIFPGLLHYPRIQYKNVILSAEKWLVPKSLCQESNPASLTELYNWLHLINLQKPFRCGEGDQTLIFNPEIEEDLHYFMLFCRNKQEIYIEEAFIPGQSQVIDENNEPYLSEFIVNLEHKEQLYAPYPFRGLWNNEHYFSNLFLPGEEWLYFEIYCHPSKSNAILLLINRNFISLFKKKIKKWFFIRYNIPADHIRLRFKLNEVKDSHELTASLSGLIAPYITSGIVADLQLKIYRQETERYGLERMNIVETCFRTDSDYIITLITKPFEINDLYLLSITLIENVMNNAGYTLDQQLRFAERMHIAFSAEFNIQSEGSKKINQNYKDFNFDHLTLSLNKLQQKKALMTERSFLNSLNACQDTEKNSVLSDLFHMHTNRLFHDDQRMHEMIMYNFLTKRIKMKIGRLKR
ncbi:thiopeptide-type bacteriocin biosynthesis protein [Pedobacter cryoconitis]|uniref:Thiopeptide-type bacteriocin biosynthesis protein n=1 Tax=Pedobacter cryoconitis TaxID=188932 RepID=A0A7W8ZSG7_9SPHI|nr:lantibiotic dehydratase [Pedobacter cryoconitis]MBB5639140.1 thiopeptide-type bacteriocin biosynthesis protein [Pedobacter cryoconitis]